MEVDLDNTYDMMMMKMNIIVMIMIMIMIIAILKSIFKLGSPEFAFF